MGMSEAFEVMAAENLGLRARAEKAESERDAARAELLRVSEELIYRGVQVEGRVTERDNLAARLKAATQPTSCGDCHVWRDGPGRLALLRPDEAEVIQRENADLAARLKAAEVENDGLRIGLSKLQGTLRAVAADPETLLVAARDLVARLKEAEEAAGVIMAVKADVLATLIAGHVPGWQKVDGAFDALAALRRGREGKGEGE